MINKSLNLSSSHCQASRRNAEADAGASAMALRDSVPVAVTSSVKKASVMSVDGCLRRNRFNCKDEITSTGVADA